MKRKVGDRVVMLDSEDRFWQKGDVGILTEKDDNGDWWCDFSGQGNPTVYMDGNWCIGRENKKLFKKTI